MEQLKVGARVSVRTATGEQREVRVAATGEHVVYVTSEAEYQEALSEGRSPEPFIGYPPEDVTRA